MGLDVVKIAANMVEAIPTFEVLDTTTNWNVPGKPSIVRISKAGIIRFSVAAVKKLGLKLDMKLAFLLMSEDKEIIYIYQSPTGLPLKAGTVSKSGISLHCCGRQHAARMLSFFSMNVKYKTFDITADTSEVMGKKCWFILRYKVHQPIKWRKK